MDAEFNTAHLRHVHLANRYTKKRKFHYKNAAIEAAFREEMVCPIAPHYGSNKQTTTR